MKILKVLLQIIAVITVYTIMIAVGQFLLDSEIIKFRYEWFKYIYYFGLGILAYYPIKGILED